MLLFYWAGGSDQTIHPRMAWQAHGCRPTHIRGIATPSVGNILVRSSFRGQSFDVHAHRCTP